MFDILRDPMWQFVAVILGILAILISYILYRKQGQKKALEYEIISSTPLLSMEEEVKGKLQILFDEEPVKQVHLIQVMIFNSGNVPILSTDFKRPVGVSFGKEAQILTAEVAEVNPDSLDVSTEIKGDEVVLVPTLLNQGDSVKLKMLVSRFGGQIAVDGRIVGVKDIRKIPERGALILLAMFVGTISVALGVTSVLIVPVGKPLWWGALLMIPLGFFLYLYIPIRYYKHGTKALARSLRYLLERYERSSR